MMSIKSRSYFSAPLLIGAAQFARQALQVERRSSENPPSPATIFEHRASVLAALLMSAASLEASINELFADTSESAGGIAQRIPDQQRALMSALWKRNIPRT